jgi:hypothetical protein
MRTRLDPIIAEINGMLLELDITDPITPEEQYAISLVEQAEVLLRKARLKLRQVDEEKTNE